MSVWEEAVKKEHRALTSLSLFGALIVILDQVSKEVVVRGLGLGGDVEVIPGIFSLVCNYNTGAAFGLLVGKQMWLAMISVIAALVLPILIWKTLVREGKAGFGSYGLTVLLAGNLGNLIDRVFRDGGVVDFLYFHIGRYGEGETGWFPFNVADAAICIGVGLYIFGSYRAQRREERDNSGASKGNH